MNMAMKTKIEFIVKLYNQPKFVLLIMVKRHHGYMVSIGSDNGSMPDGAEPLPDSMLTYDHISSHRIHLFTFACYQSRKLPWK